MPLGEIGPRLVPNAAKRPVLCGRAHLSTIKAGKREGWGRTIDVNGLGVLHDIWTALSAMRRQGEGPGHQPASVGAYHVTARRKRSAPKAIAFVIDHVGTYPRRWPTSANFLAQYDGDGAVGRHGGPRVAVGDAVGQFALRHAGQDGAQRIAVR